MNAPGISLDAVASDFCYSPLGTGATMVVSSTAGTALIGTHQYRINGGALQGSPIFASLSPGNYTIEVVDGNNCSDDLNITVRPQLRVNTSIEAEIPCGGADGQIRVQVTGGYLANLTPKSYEVSSDNGATFAAATPFTANSFLYSTIVFGDYIFRVSDNQGCIAQSQPITLNPPQSIAAASVVVSPASCGRTDNGFVTITPDATSGVPGYEISFDGGAFGTQSTFSNLIAGNSYNYVVRDSRGCETLPASVLIPLDGALPPTTTLNELQASCSVGNVVAGGIRITNVTDGIENFTFIVLDNLGVEITRVEDIARATLPIDINHVGLIPGDYTVVTLDANGCRSENTVTITTNDVTIAPINFTPPVTCDDTTFTYTVQVTPTIFPVVPTYQIRILGQPAFYALNNSFGADTHTFSNATDGIQYGVAYTVEVLAPNGCIYEQEIPPIDGFSSLDVTANSTAGFCDVNRNGEIIYNVTGFTVGNNLRIELIDNATGITTLLENVTPISDPYSNNYLTLPGDYQIVVTNLTDTCTDAVGIVIDQNLPSIDILSTDPANCTADGSITVQGNGGGGAPYTFAYMPVGTPPTAGDYSPSTTFFAPSGNYDVYVTRCTRLYFFCDSRNYSIRPCLAHTNF